MKKIKFLPIAVLVVVFLMSSFSSKAQNYWAYGNDDIYVQLKCVNNDAKVTEVSFSPVTGDLFEWVVYPIVKSVAAKKAEGKGTIYTVKSPEGVEYTFFYKKNIEKLIVIKTSDKSKLVLTKSQG